MYKGKQDQTLFGKIIFVIMIVGAIIVSLLKWFIGVPMWLLIAMLIFAIFVAIYRIIQKHRDDKSR